MFPRFSRTRHLRLPPAMEGLELDELRARATSISVDFGRLGAVAFGQPITVPVRPLVAGRARTDRGILFVDQMMPENIDAEEICALIKRDCRWRIVPRESVICLDPTTQPDQVRHFMRAFPGVQIVQHPRGFYHLEENGLRAVDRAVLDLNHDVRLYVHPSLARHESGRGIVEMFGDHRANRPKDKWYEHAADVVRYLTQHFVPLPMRDAAAEPEIETKIDRASRPLAADLKESLL